jgi:hypothetical protein
VALPRRGTDRSLPGLRKWPVRQRQCPSSRLKDTRSHKLSPFIPYGRQADIFGRTSVGANPLLGSQFALVVQLVVHVGDRVRCVGVRVDQALQGALGLDTANDLRHEHGVKPDVESRLDPLHRVGDRRT